MIAASVAQCIVGLMSRGKPAQAGRQTLTGAARRRRVSLSEAASAAIYICVVYGVNLLNLN